LTKNEKQFSVGKTRSEVLSDVSSTPTNTAPSKETVEKVSMSDAQIELPNLIGILSDII
jgi:hypothetical protein